MITACLTKMERGLLADWKSLGDGVLEIRIDHGAGWRIYFMKVGTEIVFLLGGGSKKSQDADIAAAKAIVAALKKPKRS